MLQVDNTTAVAYLRNMGGMKSVSCNEVAKAIWTWCQQNDTWLTITHVPGVENTVADRKSRDFQSNTNWSIQDRYFQKIASHWGRPDVDLFASRLNFKVDRYFS